MKQSLWKSVTTGNLLVGLFFALVELGIAAPAMAGSMSVPPGPAGAQQALLQAKSNGVPNPNLSPLSPADGPWTGSIQCQLDFQEGHPGDDFSPSTRYLRHETQTWSLTGTVPVSINDGMKIYPATWIYTGTGEGPIEPRPGETSSSRWRINVPPMPGSIAMFIRASDGRLIIRMGHTRHTVAGAIQENLWWERSGPANEWALPWIETNPDTSPSGTFTINTGNLSFFTQPGASNADPSRLAPTSPQSKLQSGTLKPPVPPKNPPTAVCNWRFSRPDPKLSGVQGETRLASRAEPIKPTSGPVPGTLPRSAEPIKPTRGEAPPTNPPVRVAPSGFTAKHIGGGAMKLDWLPVSGASQYRLEGPTLPSTGHYVHASTLGVTLNGVPPGPRSWKIAAVYAKSSWDPTLTATASAMVRYAPSHSVPWLSRLGAGNSATALHHYLSLCPECIPGIDWNTFVQKIGGIVDRIGFRCSGGSYDADCPEPPYVNVTDLGGKRSAACYLLALGKGTLCYTKTDGGLTAIVKRQSTTWFLVFTTANPGGAYILSDRVTLDSEGAKFPPHACMGCHGGRTTATGTVSDATLLPLDPGLIEISPVTTYENGSYYPNTHPKEWVAEKLIRPLNAVVIGDSSPAVARYVRGIYGNDLRGATNLDFVPQGWASQAGLYRQVIKPHCLMCHLASTSTVDLSSWDAVLRDRQRIFASVCTTRSMPHAEIPYKNFWTKDTGQIFLPGMLAASLGYTSCP